MHVEHMLLTALHATATAEDWSTAVQVAVSAVTGDDAAMAVLGIGADFEGFQRLLVDCTADLEARYIEPLNAAGDRVLRLERQVERARSEREREQTQLWAAYKQNYAQHLGTNTEAARERQRAGWRRPQRLPAPG